MRLLLAILLAALLTALGTVAQKNEMDSDSRHPLQMLEQPENDNRNAPTQSNDTDQRMESNPESNWSWAIEAINKALLFVLFGWAVGRVFMQFRRWIVVVLGILVVANFLMAQTGLVQITFQYENLVEFYDSLKVAIMNFGLIPFISVLIGIWAGVSGYFVSIRNLRLQQRTS